MQINTLTSMDNLYLVLLAFAFVLMNGFFVAAEFGIVKLRQTQAEELARTHGLRGRVLHNVRLHLDAYLSACQLGITLASLGLGWIGEPAFARLLEPLLGSMGITTPELIHGIAFTIAFATISYLHIVIGELAPKSVAIRQPEPVSLWTAIPLFSFYWIMYPFIYILNSSANLLLKWAGVQLVKEGDDAHSLSEIKKVLHASHLHGELDPGSAMLLARAIELNELTAGDLMRPDSEMVALDIGEGLEQLLLAIRKHRYSRYPVYDSDPDNLIGILHVKDLVAEQSRGDKSLDIRSLVKPVLTIHSGVSAMNILDNFQKGFPHLAIVVDEYGTVEGFVTLDHIMEALIGNIQDEFSHRKPKWSSRGDGSFAGSGSLPVYSLERLLNLEIPEAVTLDVNSVGGLVMQKLERIPQPGDRVRFAEFEIEVLEMKGPKIVKVLVRPVTDPEFP